MTDIVIKVLAFVFIIALGFVLKRVDFFKLSDTKLISKIVLNITLPCAVIMNFDKISMDASLAFVVLFGALFSFSLIALAWFLYRKSDLAERKFAMLNMSGYNIGCFALPYIQAFMGSTAVVATSLFDVGNFLVWFLIMTVLTETAGTVNVKTALKGLFSSVPIVVYLFMLAISCFGLHLPDPIIYISGVIGNANVFLSMFLIGVGFELVWNRVYLKKLCSIIIARYGFSIILSCIIFWFFPLSLELRQVLILIALAPMPIMCTVFTAKMNGDIGLSSAVNSFSILISIILMTAVMFIFQLLV